MATRDPVPPVVVFDVNGTLSDMSPIGERFADLGAGRHLAEVWFAALLRDGFALTSAGAPARFAELADGGLRVVLGGAPLDRGMDEAVEHVMSGFATLGVHRDVAAGIAALAAAGHRLVTLSNGPARVADRLLVSAGLRERFEACLSVEDAGAWKPARRAYLHAARACGAVPADLLMVAVHPWDIDGASRAGLRTAWVDRGARPYPRHFVAPGIRVRSLEELAGRLTERGGHGA